MFLQMWDLTCGSKENYSVYRPSQYPIPNHINSGLIQPYADNPVDTEHVGKHVYLQMINNAKHHIYIYTPYLIVDDSMISALTLAAKSGIDVRIITPHDWDNRFVHMTTQASYQELIESGVRIYEYTPGFLHAKVFVSDDKSATVGTINMDYRSLYLHFECGVWLYGNDAVIQCKKDFLQTLTVCKEICLEDCRHKFFYHLLQSLLKLWAPLF